MYWWHHLVLRMSKIYLHSILFWDKTTKMQKNYKDWFNYQIFGQFCSHTSGHVAFLNIHIQKCKKLQANLRGCLHSVHWLQCLFYISDHIKQVTNFLVRNELWLNLKNTHRQQRTIIWLEGRQEIVLQQKRPTRLYYSGRTWRAATVGTFAFAH